MTNNKKGAKRHPFMWHYKTLCITNVYIYLAIFRYWNIQRFQMQKTKKHRKTKVLRRNFVARATGLEPVTYGLTVHCSTD